MRFINVQLCFELHSCELGCSFILLCIYIYICVYIYIYAIQSRSIMGWRFLRSHPPIPGLLIARATRWWHANREVDGSPTVPTINEWRKRNLSNALVKR